MEDIYIKTKLQQTPGLYVTGRTGTLSNTPSNWQINKLNLAYAEYNPSMVAQGDSFIVFIAGGKLYSVGSNTDGRTGQGTSSGITLVPTQIGSDTDWTFCSAGSAYAFAIRGGRLYSWGVNTNGQTGQGTSTGNTLSPTQIGSDTNWEKVSASTGLSVAIKGGKVLTCGNNPNGRLGQGLFPSAGTIIDVFTELDSGSTGWTDCSAGVIHFIAIKSGAIWGAGSQANGRLGNGATGVGNIITVTLNNNSQTWSSVFSGNQTSFAITSSGALFGTGSQSGGGLGNGATGDTGTFTQSGSDTDWQKICTYPGTATNYSNLALARKGGKLWVTGNNAGGGLGIVDPTNITNWTLLSDITVQDISFRNYGSMLSII